MGSGILLRSMTAIIVVSNAHAYKPKMKRYGAMGSQAQT